MVETQLCKLRILIERESHSLEDIVSVQLHREVGGGRRKKVIPRARAPLTERCTADNDINLIVFLLPGYLLSTTRCRADCHNIIAGVATLGESTGLVAA